MLKVRGHGGWTVAGGGTSRQETPGTYAYTPSMIMAHGCLITELDRTISRQMIHELPPLFKKVTTVFGPGYL